MMAGASKRQNVAIATATAAWNFAVRKERFSYVDIEGAVHLHYSTVTTIVRGWIDAGLAEKIEHGGTKGNRAVFRIIPAAAKAYETAVARPKPTKHGNMWHSMRAYRAGFSVLDIIATANTPQTEVTEADAQAYCQMLVRSGHLKVLQKAVPGRRPAMYRLIRNTGPSAPREVRLRAVLDDNTGKHHLPEHLQ